MPLKKKALLVGINYHGTPNALNGCINDVNNIKKFLLQNNYKEEDIVMLTDDINTNESDSLGSDAVNSNLLPTRENILVELMRLVASNADMLYFHYSGHGTYVNDMDGDESDGQDEALVPVDCENNGLIIDDDIRGILQSVNGHQQMFCILDCCHSGTGFDLIYNLYERVSNKSFVMMKDKAAEKMNRRMRGQCIMLSGCMDNQTSADAYIGSAESDTASNTSTAADSSKRSYQGAMTHSFLQAIQYSKTYNELITNIRKVLKEGNFDQLPNLSSSGYLNLNLPIRM